MPVQDDAGSAWTLPLAVVLPPSSSSPPQPAASSAKTPTTRTSKPSSPRFFKSPPRAVRTIPQRAAAAWIVEERDETRRDNRYGAGEPPGSPASPLLRTRGSRLHRATAGARSCLRGPAASRCTAISGGALPAASDLRLAWFWAEVAELADAPDSKSGGREAVRVRFPPSACSGRCRGGP